MTRKTRLALAGSAVAGAATALAALLWLAPGGGGAPPSPQADPQVTGSVAEAAPDAPPAGETPAAAAGADEGSVVETAARPAAPAPFVASRNTDGLRLTGAVPDEAERAAILIAARARFVAEPVFADLVVDPAAEPAPPEVAAVALSALARLAEGQARLSGNTLAIDGRALWPQARQRIEDDVRVRLPESWRAALAVETPEPTPEPMIAPIPAGRDPAPQPAPEDAPRRGAADAGGTDPASAPAAYAVLPPSTREGDLAALARHPLPPRR